MQKRLFFKLWVGLHLFLIGSRNSFWLYNFSVLYCIFQAAQWPTRRLQRPLPLQTRRKNAPEILFGRIQEQDGALSVSTSDSSDGFRADLRCSFSVTQVSRDKSEPTGCSDEVTASRCGVKLSAFPAGERGNWIHLGCCWRGLSRRPPSLLQRQASSVSE